MDSQSIDEPSETESVGGTAQSEVPLRLRIGGWVAWAIIVAMIGYISISHFLSRNEHAGDPSIAVCEIQAKYLVGAASFAVVDDQTALEQIQLIFGTGPLRQRLVGIALIGELVSPQAAATSLAELNATIENGTPKGNDVDAATARLLRKIFEARIERSTIGSSLTPDS